MPGTASKSLLLLYTCISISQAIYIYEMGLSASVNKVNHILQLVMAFSAVIIMLLMPLRDPEMSNDQISPVSALPSSQLRSPEDNLTVWQFLTVSWMSPLIALGRKRQLNDEDVWALGYEFQHGRLHENFRGLRGSVMQRLLVANGIDLILLALLGVVDLFASRYLPRGA